MLCVYIYIYICIHYTHRYYMIFYIISTRFFLRQNSRIGCSKMLEMKIDIFSFSLLSQNRIEFWDLNRLGTPDSTIFQGRNPHGFRRFALEKSQGFFSALRPHGGMAGTRINLTFRVRCHRCGIHPSQWFIPWNIPIDHWLDIPIWFDKLFQYP